MYFACVEQPSDCFELKFVATAFDTSFFDVQDFAAAVAVADLAAGTSGLVASVVVPAVQTCRLELELPSPLMAM